MMEGVNSNMIFLIHCKNFFKCHNVPPPSTTIKNKLIKNYISGKKTHSVCKQSCHARTAMSPRACAHTCVHTNVHLCMCALMQHLHPCSRRNVCTLACAPLHTHVHTHTQVHVDCVILDNLTFLCLGHGHSYCRKSSFYSEMT
jgi:hypothetical protein